MKIAVLGSTRGTDLQYIIDAIESGKLTDAEISAVISNKKDAGILERARKHNIAAVFIDSSGKSREDFDKEIIKILEEKGVELVLLIGYMRFISKPFVEKYRNKIMNIHPSLLPAFAGGMDKNVHAAILEHGCKVTGCTLHFVDEGADTGPIVVQKAAKVEEDDTVDTLKEKVQKLEGEALIEAIELFRDKKLKIKGRVVHILR